jgi:hypothetical protein
MQPTSATTISRPDLGAIAYEYLLTASQRGFIGLGLLPIFEVPEKNGEYPKIPIESLLKLQSTKRAPRGGYGRSDWEFEMGNYDCEEHGWEEPVDDSEANMYRRYFDAEEIATMRAVDVILRGQEARIAAKVFNTTNITGTADVTIPWNTSATCTPLADVDTAKIAMRAASGLDANKIAMSSKVFNKVLMAAELKDAFKYTNPIEVGSMEAKRRLLAQYLGVDEVLVGGAIKDSAKKGQSFSIADIWDDEYVLLAKVSDGGRDLRDPCLGRTFLWTGDTPQNIVTEQYRDEKVRSNIYRVRQNVDEEFVFAGAGYLMGNIIHP